MTILDLPGWWTLTKPQLYPRHHPGTGTFARFFDDGVFWPQEASNLCNKPKYPHVSSFLLPISASPNVSWLCLGVQALQFLSL